MRRVALSTGVELAVHTYGDGVPVLLLHAWAETHRTFDLLVPRLPRTMRLVVPDQRGVGESSKPSAGTGHLVLWEQPERVTSDMTGFITSAGR